MHFTGHQTMQWTTGRLIARAEALCLGAVAGGWYETGQRPGLAEAMERLACKLFCKLACKRACKQHHGDSDPAFGGSIIKAARLFKTKSWRPVTLGAPL